jgi:hypothetical protein
VEPPNRRSRALFVGAIIAVVVVAVAALLLLSLLNGDSGTEVAEQPEEPTTTKPADETTTTGADLAVRPTVVVGTSLPLPPLPSSTEVPVADDPALGLTAPSVAGSSISGEPVTFGETGSAALVIMVTVADTAEGTVNTAASLLDESGRISNVDAILVVSGDPTEAGEWLDSADWPGQALIDNSGSVLLDSFGVGVTPHVIAIDTEGRVAARASGALDSADLRLVSLAALTGPVATTTAPAPAETTTTVAVVVRNATLYSNFAKVRELPHLDADEVTTLVDQEGLSLQVFGAHHNGWYQIRAGTVEGWIFGTFVMPPDSGLYIAQTRGGETAELLDDQGNPSTVRNQSGPKVLVTDTSGDLWQVILPDGGAAWVDPAVMTIASVQ